MTLLLRLFIMVPVIVLLYAIFIELVFNVVREYKKDKKDE